MSEYQIKIELKTDLLAGLGEGYGTIIDSDVVLDDVGLPYIPSKRIKGIMRESAEELNDMLGVFHKNINIDEIFGITGKKEGLLHLSNFFLEEYKHTKAWLEYLINKPNIVNKQSITEQLTSLRYSTAIDYTTGVAKDHSLRTERVINKGNIFAADAEFPNDYESELALICQNMRRIGTKRTRGLGKVEVKLIQNGKNLTDAVIKDFEKEAYNESN